MTTTDVLTPEFVRSAPELLRPGILYVSMEYASALHLCCCGCGEKVVTPLTPTDWSLTFNGVGVSLNPSIGNWGFACRSHYIVRNNRIHWASEWDEEAVAAGRALDRARKGAYFGSERAEPPRPSNPPPTGWRKWLSFWR